MSREFLDRIVPTHLLELPRAAGARTLQRIPQPVGVIGHLKPGLAARAELSLVRKVDLGYGDALSEVQHARGRGEVSFDDLAKEIHLEFDRSVDHVDRVHQ